jgi:hypothetical protein
MAQDIKNPATLAAGRARNVFSGLAALNNSEDNAPNLETQDRRAVWLARRFNLSLATAVAGLLRKGGAP